MAFSKWLDLVKLLAPVVLVNVKGGEKIAPLVPLVINGITEAEQIKGATGPEKKAHVLNIVDAAIQTINATSKVHIDLAGAKAATSGGIDAVVSAVNAVAKTGAPE